MRTMPAVVGGTIPALLTPFAPGGERVDLDLLDVHAGWLAARGVRCVSPMGTTGEGVSLSLGERRAVIERLARRPGGVAMLPGTGTNALPETIELSRFALEHGAVGVLVAPPSYYDPFDRRGVDTWFCALLDALPPDARVFLYHIPRQTGVPIEDGTLRLLRARYGERVAGTKDSSGDVEHLRAWLRDFPELTILNGSDASAAAAYAAGGRGVLTMLANLFPERLEQIREGREVEQAQSFLVGVRELVARFPAQAALKHLLHLVSGLPVSAVRPPLQELDDGQRELLEERFAALAATSRAWI